jgi:hypothetical protein
MKKLDAILRVGLLVAIVGVILLGSYWNEHYSMKCTAIDRHTFKDSTGHTWSVSDSLKVGREYRVVFDNNCTDDTRNDDKVVKFN